MRDTAYKVLQTKERLISQRQKEPTIDEIAKILEIPRDDIIVALNAIMDPISLHEPVFMDGGDATCVMDHVSDAKNTDEIWLEHIALKEAMRRLNQREKNIMSMRFYDGKTQMEVANEIGISQAQVSRLEKNALKHMRKHV